MWKKAILGLLPYLIGAIISAFIISSRCDTANAAEPCATVEFNDLQHLWAITDSVIDICDTTMVWKENMGFWMDSLRNFPPPIPPISESYDILKKPVVTCRELICLRVRKHPKKLEGTKCIPCPVEPGEVIICWRQVKP